MVFSDKNLDEMLWHDCQVYGIGFDKDLFRLYIDLDYILKWEKLNTLEGNYRFLVAPAKLEFENVWNLSINIDTSLELQINSIRRYNIQKAKNFIDKSEFDWELELIQGEITFKSIGFKLYLKSEPVWMDRQGFNLIERGGIKF